MGCNGSREPDGTSYDIERKSVPINKIEAWRSSKPLTIEEILKMRKDFWETRVEGVEIVWSTLKACSEALIENDMATANAILEASAITTPKGSLALCYDQLGNKYEVPLYCFSFPSNITSGGLNPDGTNAEEKKDLTGEKEIRIRLCNLGRDLELKVQMEISNKVSDLKESVEGKAKENKVEFSKNKMRLFISGREMKDEDKICDFVNGNNEIAVIMAMVRND